MQSQYQLKFYLIMIFVLIFAGTFLFQHFENLSFPDAFYFCLVTIATVGYGDITPATMPGKATALILIVMGAGTFLGVMANATQIVFDKRGKQIRLEKLNILMGFFFSETGTDLLKMLTIYDSGLNPSVRKSFNISSNWEDSDFTSLKKQLADLNLNIDASTIRFVEIKKISQ
ncbi:MAG: ion transport 2 domain-containing protein [Candidatus Magnetoglobus multicellularis str. Araruama]|uniref:Ion transport 2 domain-containing protein n=1 Tax=Candidatus Magnetoglobus multicellularis str. Araruama TaxID=890399 RepID=A0A1V1PIG4_9BACT|nr:MAG: ion transport 2 domain-containing protein [Candidatus Magnetoglobus multicellularis str. Araruama]